MEIRQGYKQTEVGIIPKEWEVKKLGECFEFLSTNSYSREKMTYEEQEYMNIHYGDIHMKYGATLDIEKMKGKIPYIKAEETLPKKIILVEEGDLLVADASEDYKDIGKSTEILNIKDNKVLGGLHTLLLRDKNNSFANGYKGYILRNEKILKEVKRIATGISVLGISKTNLSELNILIPPLKEQEKIAEILTNYDKDIEQEELLIEKEKEFKKGMMQKIFSQEIRFKDDNGEDYPEWEEKTLGNYINFLTGYPFNSKKFNEEKRGVPLIRIRNLLDSNISTYYEGEYENKYIIKREDILIGMDGDFNVVKWKNNGALLNQRIVKVFSKNNLELCNTFLYYILEKPIKNINLKTFSTTVKHLSVKDIEKIIVNLPILKEQEKIANFLSDIDNKIENIEKELEGLKEFKKGLLQQMFV